MIFLSTLLLSVFITISLIPLFSRVAVRVQALAIAGGLNPFAKRNQIKIFRKAAGTTLTFNFNYDDVTDGGKLQQNILLKRGDVIVVP